MRINFRKYFLILAIISIPAFILRFAYDQQLYDYLAKINYRNDKMKLVANFHKNEDKFIRLFQSLGRESSIEFIGFNKKKVELRQVVSSNSIKALTKDDFLILNNKENNTFIDFYPIEICNFEDGIIYFNPSSAEDFDKLDIDWIVSFQGKEDDPLLKIYLKLINWDLKKLQKLQDDLMKINCWNFAKNKDGEISIGYSGTPYEYFVYKKFSINKSSHLLKENSSGIINNDFYWEFYEPGFIFCGQRYYDESN